MASNASRKSHRGRRNGEVNEARADPVWSPFSRTGQTIPALAGGTPEGVVWANSAYVVVVRTIHPKKQSDDSGPGVLVWLSIKGRANEPIRDWRDFQRIKNELVGKEVEAVELYPAESRLVDCANQYHLWCFPGFRFPFGFGERYVAQPGDFPDVSQRPSIDPNELSILDDHRSGIKSASFRYGRRRLSI